MSPWLWRPEVLAGGPPNGKATMRKWKMLRLWWVNGKKYLYNISKIDNGFIVWIDGVVYSLCFDYVCDVFVKCVEDMLVFFVCVCVCGHLNRRKTSFVAHHIIYCIILYDTLKQGVTGVPGCRWPMKTPPRDPWNVPAGLWWCTWAHLSRSWWPP